MPNEIESVFKALADPTRRRLLDRLHERNGQTLTELCDGVGMARQSATQHLSILEDANLVNSVRRGREKLHYLNPVPLHEMQERWIDKFERPRFNALSAIKRQAEETTMADKPTFVYTTYIESTAERVWHALTDADLTAQYWGHANVSDWEVGSGWEHRRVDGSGVVDVVGTVLESVPPERLVITFAGSPGQPAQDPSRVTFTPCWPTSSHCSRPATSCPSNRGRWRLRPPAIRTPEPQVMPSRVSGYFSVFWRMSPSARNLINCSRGIALRTASLAPPLVSPPATHSLGSAPVS